MSARSVFGLVAAAIRIVYPGAFARPSFDTAQLIEEERYGPVGSRNHQLASA